MRVHVLRVFVSSSGEGGNPLGVVLEGGAVAAPADRQRIAAELGYSETVFVEDRTTGELAIFTPTTELPFAGHPLVGTAWLLFRSGAALPALRPPAGEVPVWRDEHDRVWIRGRPEWCPPFHLEQLGSPREVDALTGPPEGIDLHYPWAWEEEASGRIRARMFGPGVGVTEDEATGSAALRLGALVGRRLLIRQGSASLICVEPAEGGAVDVGGQVRLDDTVELR